MAYKTIEFEIRDGVAHLTLNRPEAANSLNLEMAQELFEVSLRCDEDRAVRAVLLSGTGKLFCAGGDLKSFASQEPEHLPGFLKQVTTYAHAAISHFARMDAPLIGAVHGSAAGAGMSLVCACDLVVAAQSARFTMAYTRAGLTPDGSGTYFLPRIVGYKRALELILTNRVLSAGEALEWGLVTRVVPDAELAEATTTLARQLAEGATHAFGISKQLLRHSWGEALETQMELESRAIAEVARGAESREGIAAFLGKRPPRFKTA